MKWVAAVAVGTSLLCGCRTLEFYAQAARGQYEVLSRARPVAEVAATTNDAGLRAKLELARRLLDFAETELKLPSRGAYSSYAELGRKHLVWVMHVSPELSMEPRSWWYPVAGRQVYRGYFLESLAQREAERLRAAGNDVWLGGVDAYSTLGWFRDPLVDTFMHYDEVDLAETLFHELVHRKFYIRGKTAENEALAEAVARAGMRRWFQHTGRATLIDEYDARLAKIQQAGRLIIATSERLKVLYASSLPKAEKHRLKRLEITRLRRALITLRTTWGRGLNSWINEPINNARLNSFTTYEELIPHYTALLDAHEGNFSEFWAHFLASRPHPRLFPASIGHECAP